MVQGYRSDYTKFRMGKSVCRIELSAHSALNNGIIHLLIIKIFIHDRSEQFKFRCRLICVLTNIFGKSVFGNIFAVYADLLSVINNPW